MTLSSSAIWSNPTSLGFVREETLELKEPLGAEDSFVREGGVIWFGGACIVSTGSPVTGLAKSRVSSLCTLADSGSTVTW